MIVHLFGKLILKDPSYAVVDVQGIGKKFSEKLKVIGIFLVKDVLLHYPRDYLDYSSLLTINQLKDGYVD